MPSADAEPLSRLHARDRPANPSLGPRDNDHQVDEGVPQSAMCGFSAISPKCNEV